jgi:hypothetical protein
MPTSLFLGALFTWVVKKGQTTAVCTSMYILLISLPCVGHELTRTRTEHVHVSNTNKARSRVDMGYIRTACRTAVCLSNAHYQRVLDKHRPRPPCALTQNSSRYSLHSGLAPEAKHGGAAVRTKPPKTSTAPMGLRAFPPTQLEGLVSPGVSISFNDPHWLDLMQHE